MTFAASILGDNWGFHHGDVGSGWWILMMLGMVIFWGAVIALVVWIIRRSGGASTNPPQETLRRRLADGSISIEEYERRLAALETSTPAPTPRPDSPAAPQPPQTTSQPTQR
jgi:putative membrane protein